MCLNEEQLLLIVQQFKNAIELTDFSKDAVGDEGYFRMCSFPDGACAEACTLLGIYLVEEFGVEPLTEFCAQIEKGKTWFGTHHWLEHGNIIIDISANQFPMVDETIIVRRKSLFHQRFAKNKAKITSVFGLKHQPTWMHSLYRAVRNKL